MHQRALVSHPLQALPHFSASFQPINPLPHALRFHATDPGLVFHKPRIELSPSLHVNSAFRGAVQVTELGETKTSLALTRRRSWNGTEVARLCGTVQPRVLVPKLWIVNSRICCFCLINRQARSSCVNTSPLAALTPSTYSQASLTGWWKRARRG